MDSVSQDLIARQVRIRLYTEENLIEVEVDESILEAAMRQGLQPPFSCQLGACGTCRATLKSGRVVMDESEALTEREIEEGQILTCQSHPLTDNVFVDYD